MKGAADRVERLSRRHMMSYLLMLESHVSELIALLLILPSIHIQALDSRP